VETDFPTADLIFLIIPDLLIIVNILDCLVLYYTIILEIQIGQIWDSQRVNMDEKRAFAGVGNRWCGCSTHYNTRTSSAPPTAWGFEDGC
jgi:hypothetical protein